MHSNRDRRIQSWIASILLVLPTWFCAGCAAPPFDAKAVVEEWAAFMKRDYVLKAADKISITVYGAEDLTQEVVVSPRGTVHLMRIAKPLIAKGKSIGAFRREVQAAYAEVLQNAEVTVQLTEASENTIYVAGEVGRPGAVPFVPGMTLAQAISSAGGFDIRAKSSDVRLLRYQGGNVRTFRVNVNDILYDEGSDFLVLPGDVVWCQTSAIADLNDIVALYITRMLPIPITGVSLGQ